MNEILEIQKIGNSELGQSIDLWKFSLKSTADVLIIAGVHGDEIEGIALAEALAHKLMNVVNRESIEAFKSNGIAIIPRINPDGTVLKQRSNKNDVDLNRNLPTSNWSSVASNTRYKPGPSPASEKETKAFIDVLKTLKPKLIISLHSYSKTLLLFPANSVSDKYMKSVERLSQSSLLPIVEEMDYKIFGSLSRFGFENKIATLTVELPRGQEMSAVIATYLMPVWEFIHEII